MKRYKSYIIPVFFVFAALAAALICVRPLFASANGAAKQYTNFTTVSRYNNTLEVEPVAVFEAASQEGLDTISGASKKPAVVMLEVADAAMNIKLTDGNKAFGTVFDDDIKGVAIPALRIETEEVAEGFISYFKTQYRINDILIVSSDIKVLEKIYADEETYIAGGVYDVRSADLPQNRYEFFDTIGAANTAGATIIMIDAAKPNAASISRYIAAMTKVCWGYSDGSTVSAVNAISCGTMGVVGGNIENLKSAFDVFNKNGHIREQFLAAHRGITKYANENSLTSIAASVNEGATHIEIDLQITSDGRIVICHNSDAGSTSTAPGSVWFAVSSLGGLKNYKLKDFSTDYDETFPTLEEVVEAVKNEDIILILELKLDNCSKLAHTSLGAISQLNSIMNRAPAMKGKWFAITFYEPYAATMRELAPQIPVGFLGFAEADWDHVAASGEEPASGAKVAWKNKPAGESLNDISGFISFMRKYNIVPDVSDRPEMHTLLQDYLARGYHFNTWTYDSTEHFETGINIATTNAAEQAALFVKKIDVETVSAADIAAGKVNAKCTTYNGWVYTYECDLILVDGNTSAGSQAKVLLYFYQDTGSGGYGLYSGLISVTVA